MTRKDYVLIAAALKETSPKACDDDLSFGQHRLCCESVAAALAADNPRFDRVRFLKACGVQP